MSKTVYALIDGDTRRSFVKRWRLFDDFQDALKAAREVGGWPPGSISCELGFSDKIGMANSYRCGDVDLTIVKLEVVPGRNSAPTE